MIAKVRLGDFRPNAGSRRDELVPSSTTATLFFLRKRKSVKGKPTKLLKLPSVFSTLPRSDLAAEVSFCENRRDHFLGRRLAVGTGDRQHLGRQTARRRKCARSPNAPSVSSTLHIVAVTDAVALGNGAMHDHARRAASHSAADKAMAIEALTFEGDKNRLPV